MDSLFAVCADCFVILYFVIGCFVVCCAQGYMLVRLVVMG